MVTKRSHIIRFHALEAIEKKSQNPDNVENGKGHNPWVSTGLAGVAELLLECLCQLLEPVDLLVDGVHDISGLPVDLLVGRLQQVQQGQAQACQGDHQNSQNLHSKQILPSVYFCCCFLYFTGANAYRPDQALISITFFVNS